MWQLDQGCFDLAQVASVQALFYTISGFCRHRQFTYCNLLQFEKRCQVSAAGSCKPAAVHTTYVSYVKLDLQFNLVVKPRIKVLARETFGIRYTG